MHELAKTLQLGELVYTLQVDKPLRAHHGAWKCPVCDATTDCGVYSTAQAAFDAAERNARLHHAAAHEKK